MASRMKKLFHRKRDEDDEDPQQRRNAPATASNEPALRTSLYESTTAGGLPQTGDYPVKGNDSSVMLQAGRKSSVRSLRGRRSSSRSSQYNASYQPPPPTQYDGPRMNPRMSPPPSHSNAPGLAPYDPYQDSSYPNGGQDDRRKRWSHTPLPQEFAGLNLGNTQSPTTVTTTVTTTHTPHQRSFPNRGNINSQVTPSQSDDIRYRTPAREKPPQESYATNGVPKSYGYGSQNNAGIQTTNQRDYQQPSQSQPHRSNLIAPRHKDYSTPDRQEEYDASLARQKSIPRKQVGTAAQVPLASTPPSKSSAPYTNHSRQESASKPLPSAPVSPISDYAPQRAETTIQPTSIVDRSRTASKGVTTPKDAQDIVDRAKSNTYDTEVVERIAPAVVHENVSKNVHHIREEVITREVHNHDIYHRILPVIDVEVLPPRHFLPVEGGGLVEISASEVPGRGHNWVIAETASKIPSDQAAPRGEREFTARSFLGREGDAVRYVTPEGHEKTEETWVHPPELEEGARLTGQSWPMVFGSDAGEQVAHEKPTSKAAKRKSPKKASALQASPASRAGVLGRTM